MKITFVVPALNLTGGIRVVAIYASFLANKGHEVTVVSPNKKIHRISKRLNSFLRGNGWDAGSHFSTDFFTNPKVHLNIVETCRDITDNDVPDADLVIATFWNTSEWVNSFPERKGKKIYFIQHYEIHPWLPIDRVKATLSLSFKHIVVANWLKSVLVEQYDANDITVVPNGVDQKQFYSEPRAKQDSPTVGFFYSERTFKGCDVIVEAINLVRKHYPNLRVLAMGMKKPMKDIPLPENTKYFLNPPQNEIKNIYNQCDAWLFGSRSEGFGLTILEAMACRTPVIGTKAGAAPELLSLSEGLLIDINDAEQMASAIIKFIKMSKPDWQALSLKSYDVACEYGWGRSSVLFEKTLDEVYRAG